MKPSTNAFVTIENESFNDHQYSLCNQFQCFYATHSRDNAKRQSLLKLNGIIFHKQFHSIPCKIPWKVHPQSTSRHCMRASRSSFIIQITSYFHYEVSLARTMWMCRGGLQSRLGLHTKSNLICDDIKSNSPWHKHTRRRGRWRRQKLE